MIYFINLLIIFKFEMTEDNFEDFRAKVFDDFNENGIFDHLKVLI